MKKLLLLISFTILFLYSFTQTDVQRDNRVSPILKQALASKSGYNIYGRTGTAGFINIAVLNQSSHTLCWFTCHGRLFDSTKLTNREYELVISKHLDPFVLYQLICNEYLDDIAASKDIYRIYGARLIVDSLNPNYRALLTSEPVRMAKTPLQKLAAIENIRKNILTQLAYLNCADPFMVQSNPLFTTNKVQAGAMIKTKDSTIYYNIDPTSAVTKIGLYKNSPEKLYIYNRLSELIDSISVLPERYDLLLKEKTDVFLLYRGWLEMQWQGARSNIIRFTKSIYTINAGIYSDANLMDDKAIEKELYSQINAIGTKINLLISPEEKSIEQAVYETYKNETSEITYIPLLGIGYDLNHKRGLKEYELTNHLGNVLATVSDKKIGVSSSSDSSLIDHYEPDIVSAQDYYPFGMLQPGRFYLFSAGGGKYRYGFNGKENDNEVKGEGNQQDYGMRVYDPRLGKFLSVDPLTKDYPWYTPYQFAGNKPIWAIDLDGLEEYYSNTGVYLGHGKDNKNNELRLATKYEPLKDNAGNVVKDQYAVFESKKITIKSAGNDLKQLLSDAKKAGGPDGKERGGYFILDVKKAELYFRRSTQYESKNTATLTYQDPTESNNGITNIYGNKDLLVIGSIHTHQFDSKYLGYTVSVMQNNKQVQMKWSSKASFLTQFSTPTADGNEAVSSNMNSFAIGMNLYLFSRKGIKDGSDNLSSNSNVFNNKFNLLQYALEKFGYKR